MFFFKGWRLTVLVVLAGCLSDSAGFAQTKLTRPAMKCLSVPMYYPSSGILFSTQVADDVAYLNADMIRVEFNGEGDATNSINYAAYDYLADKAGERGIELLGLIDYSSVKWDTRAEWGTVAFRDRFVQRVQELVTHFHNRTHPIKHWEIWNEEDIALPEFNVRIEPEPYAALLAASYDAIKAIDPDAVVSLGGISPKNFEYSTNYLADLYATQSIADYTALHSRRPFDVVSVHPYPEYFSSPNPTLATILNNRIKSVMNQNGDADMKVWLTEMGWSSYFVTENEQATYLRDSYLLLDTMVDPANPDNGPYVEKYFWFAYADFSTVDKWGLYTQDRNRQKPSYFAFLNLTDPGPEPPPIVNEPGENPPVWNGTSDADLAVQVANNDLIEGMTGTITAGGFHEANVGTVSALTNGLFDTNGLTLVLEDYGAPALRVRYEFPQPVDISEVRLFAGHAGDGGNRAFQSDDIYINDQLAVSELNTGNYGQTSGGSRAVSVVRWLPDTGKDYCATWVNSIDVVFWCASSLDGNFVDRWSPIDDPLQDTDGLGPAYVAPIAKEIDVIGQPSQAHTMWVLH